MCASRRLGSPWENEYIESLNGDLGDELLNGEMFDTLLEEQVLIIFRCWDGKLWSHSWMPYIHSGVTVSRRVATKQLTYSMMIRVQRQPLQEYKAL